MSVENPGGKRLWRGWYVCECVTLIYPIMEQRMQAQSVPSDAYVFQGSYNGSVSASAGTHDGGGTTDHSLDGWDQLRVQRECGAAAWGRTPAQGFDPHCHSVLCGCPHLSSGAADQVADYRNGRNGLADNGPDDGPDVPYITWQDAYAKYANQQPKELFGMTDKISKYRGKSQVYQEDNWNHHLATEDNGYATIATNSKGMVDVVLSITDGLEPGDEIGVRWVYLGTKDDSTNVDWQSQPIDLVHNGGTSRHQVVCHFDLKPKENGWDHKLRLAVNTGGKRVTFGTIECKGWEDAS